MQRSPRSVEAIVEQQVEKWRQERARIARPAPPPRPVITVSRQFGALGAELAWRASERLGFSYWNRELVDEIARDAHVSSTLVRALDEHHQASIVETVRAMAVGGPLGGSEYFRSLAKVVHAIAVSGAAVLVGRGLGFLLDPRRTLRLRVVAPLDDRIRGVAERSGIPAAEARAKVARVDAERRDFVRDHFGRDADDPAAYDLHVNTRTLGLDAALDVVEAAVRARFGEVAVAAGDSQT